MLEQFSLIIILINLPVSIHQAQLVHSYWYQFPSKYHAIPLQKDQHHHNSENDMDLHLKT